MKVKTCPTCKSAGKITEEIPYWSKKMGNYSPYPKMITCDAKYALENRDEIVEEPPEIKDKEVQLELKLGSDVSEKWVFYFAANSTKDPSTILTPKEAYGSDENHGIAKTNDKGKVTLTFNCPQIYRIDGVTYSRHVHYLVEEDGVWSNMQTERVICEVELEEF